MTAFNPSNAPLPSKDAEEVAATIYVADLCAAPVLQAISLSVGAGEVAALVGSQGSGKSTLLKVLAGQRLPDSGQALVAGVDCRLPDVRRVVGVMGEAWGHMPRLTVQENLQLFARLWGLPDSRVAEVLKATDLLPLRQTLAHKLRTGEAARLSLARALLHDPPVLLLDEPIGDVDRESASLIGFAVSEAAERGKTVLLATFGHPKALALASRLIYIEDGRVLQPTAPSPAVVAPKPGQTEAPAAGKATPIRHIAARRDDRVLLFAPADIRYAYAQDKAVYVQTADGPGTVNMTLSDLEERLTDQGFFRCHRAFLVNVQWVRELAAWTRDSYSLILKDGKEVPLSKHRAQALKDLLGW